jgi:hypothetical protein
VAYSIAARPDQILEFYLRQPYMVRDCKSGSQDVAPSAVVVGPCTYRRIAPVLCGRFLVFTIHFHASGFHQLFRAPMHELVDCAHDAESVIGNSVLEIEQRLAEASEIRERVRAATVFLLQRLTARPSFDPVAMIANRFAVRGALRVGDAAVRAGLSIRQFERRLSEKYPLCNDSCDFIHCRRGDPLLTAKLRSEPCDAFALLFWRPQALAALEYRSVLQRICRYRSKNQWLFRRPFLGLDFT